MKVLLKLLLIIFICPLSYAGNEPSKMVEKLIYTNVQELENIGLNRFFNLTEQEELVLVQESKSLSGTHYHYQHHVFGKPLMFSELKIHIYPNGEVLMQNYLVQLPKLLTSSDFADCYVYLNGELVGLSKGYNEQLAQWEYETENHKTLYSFDRYKYYGDTTVKAKVFMPNPVNSSDTIYGGNYKDNGDQNNTELNNELYEVNVHAIYENDSFKLDHPKVHLKEVSFPIQQDDYTLEHDSFFYNRSETEFEAVNAYYHIVNFYSYLETIGQDQLALEVDVDVHAIGGSDNSRFDPNNYTIEYGDGGVDDAEDAEVVIHEYVHSLSTTAHTTNFPTRQREAMEEGNCDYLCKSYSRSLNDNNSYKVFSWDGHNEFWNGFVINSTDHYPEDLRNTKDGDRDMWSSTLMCIHDFIGREAADSLVLEHFYYQTDSANMVDMAKVLMHLDSVLFNHRYYGPIRGCLESRGLVDHLVSVDEQVPSSLFEIKNSHAFLNGSAAAEIVTEGKSQILIYNSAGQLIQTHQSQGSLKLYPQDFTLGLYLIQIKMKNQLFVVKMMR